MQLVLNAFEGAYDKSAWIFSQNEWVQKDHMAKVLGYIPKTNASKKSTWVK